MTIPTDPVSVQAMRYLSHYGYLTGAILSPAVTPALAVVSILTAITDFQKAAGIPVTGNLDQQTLDAMNRPRCGVLDVQRVGVEEAKWKKNTLTYFIESYVSGISKSDVDDIIRLAFQQWSDVADVTITPLLSPAGANMIISTGKGQAQGFDGPSGTLAWAYLPTGNDQQLLCRFDLDETWTVADAGIRLLNVACHEFGHLLGLPHSKVSTALMAPFYSPSVSKPQPTDDVSRMQALYGTPKPVQPIPPVTPPTAPPPGKQVIAFEIEGKITAVSIPGYKVIPK